MTKPARIFATIIVILITICLYSLFQSDNPDPKFTESFPADVLGAIIVIIGIIVVVLINRNKEA